MQNKDSQDHKDNPKQDSVWLSRNGTKATAQNAEIKVESTFVGFAQKMVPAYLEIRFVADLYIF